MSERYEIALLRQCFQEAAALESAVGSKRDRRYSYKQMEALLQHTRDANAAIADLFSPAVILVPDEVKRLEALAKMKIAVFKPEIAKLKELIREQRRRYNNILRSLGLKHRNKRRKR